MKLSYNQLLDALNQDVPIVVYWSEHANPNDGAYKGVQITHNPSSKVYKLVRSDVGLVAETPNVMNLLVAYNDLADWVDSPISNTGGDGVNN